MTDHYTDKLREARDRHLDRIELGDRVADTIEAGEDVQVCLSCGSTRLVPLSQVHGGRPAGKDEGEGAKAGLGAAFTGSPSSPPPDPGGHVLYVCDGKKCAEQSTCMFCDGGLSNCTRCGAFEGAWPDSCPGERMTDEQSDDVYAGQLNFRDGAWREGECCQVMRPARDSDRWMAEHGYRRGDASKGERPWVEVGGPS
jgi:hypothetical protein